MRVRKVLLLLSAVMVAGTFAGVRAVDAARTKISVAKKALNPRALGGGGGRLWVVVNVNRKGGGVSNVGVRTNIPGSGGGMAVLAAAGKGRYQGYCTVPRNTNTYSVKANVVVSVTSPDGTEERRIGTVKVGPGSDTYPPPPPAD